MSHLREVDSDIALCITFVRTINRTLGFDKQTLTTPSTFGVLRGYVTVFIYSPVLLFRFLGVIRNHDFSNQHQIVDIRDDPAWLRSFVLDHSRQE
ncbi:hypothetical protein FIBSPDRAFT_518386 [Athelia psychrophila]|uniref:Uncharacterized protein n=1 Tax=Athelia psychrophila TaxID=1759441 RepID=A0A166V7T1_9AGAM|nr:hypothetical protein FIBSPDRAFT_518386 [Fibularhizoctonia sp. CBS 109695]